VDITVAPFMCQVPRASLLRPEQVAGGVAVEVAGVDQMQSLGALARLGREHLAPFMCQVATVPLSCANRNVAVHVLVEVACARAVRVEDGGENVVVVASSLSSLSKPTMNRPSVRAAIVGDNWCLRGGGEFDAHAVAPERRNDGLLKDNAGRVIVPGHDETPSLSPRHRRDQAAVRRLAVKMVPQQSDWE